MEFAVRTINLVRIFERRVYKKSVIEVEGSPSAFLMSFYYRHFCKKKMEVKAINNVNLDVKKGEVMCILGPNGSGKSTLLKIMAGILYPTSGDALINGVSIWKVKSWQLAKMVTYVPGMLSGAAWVNPFLTVKRNLEFYANLYEISKSKISYALEAVNLKGLADVRAATFSTGMLARLLIAAGLMKESAIYLMDEPMAGLSREIVVDLLYYIRRLSREYGATVLYATNIVEEAERIADRVALLANGELVSVGAPSEVIRIYPAKEAIEVEVGNISEMKKVEQKLLELGYDYKILDWSSDAELLKFNVFVNDSRLVLPELVDFLIKLGGRLRHLEIRAPTLEDILIKVCKEAEGMDFD